VTRPLAFVTRFPDFANGKSSILLRFAALKDDGLFSSSARRRVHPVDKLAAAQLYGRIFYQTGGAGDPEIYRDPPLTQKLFDRIEGWIPTLPGVYDPGWPALERHWTSVDT